MISVQEFYVLRGQIQNALVAFVRLQRKTQSLKVKANFVMSVKRRLFNQEFLKCFLNVLLSSTRVIFYNCFILILLGCTHSRTDCSSKRKELRITLLCYPQLTNPCSNRFFLRPSVESVQVIIKSCNLRRLESLPQLHWMYKIKQRGFYPSN